MKAKRKYLNTLLWFCNLQLPAKTTPKVRMQMVIFTKAVKDEIELLNKVELDIGKEIIQDFDGTFMPEQIKEYHKYLKEIKPVHEEEIELPEPYKFTLTMWPDFPGSSSQLADLVGLGMIAE